MSMRVRPTGICKLCQRKQLLCDSHYLPAFFYRLTSGTGRNPVLITPRYYGSMGRHTIDYLLCEACEQRFNKEGEEWVIRNCSLAPGSFPLREQLLKQAPEMEEQGTKFYAATEAAKIDCGKVAYFALSIFWRASVHRWRIGKRLDMPISLGPYREILRRFLVGGTQLPREVYLTVWVSSLPTPHPVGCYPYSLKTPTGFIHTFNIPGIEFTLKVGRNVEPYYPFISFLNPEKRPILLGEDGEERAMYQIGRYLQSSGHLPYLMSAST